MFVLELLGIVVTMALMADPGGSPGVARSAMTKLLDLSDRVRADRYTFYFVLQRTPEVSNLNEQAYMTDPQYAELRGRLWNDSTEEAEKALKKRRNWTARNLRFVNLPGDQQRAVVLNEFISHIQRIPERLKDHSSKHTEREVRWANRRAPVIRWLDGWLPKRGAKSIRSYFLAGSVEVAGDPDWPSKSDEELMGLIWERLIKRELSLAGSHSMIAERVEGHVTVAAIARPGRPWSPDEAVSEFASRRLLGIPLAGIWWNPEFKGGIPMSQWGWWKLKEEKPAAERPRQGIAAIEWWTEVYRAARGRWLE